MAEETKTQAESQQETTEKKEKKKSKKDCEIEALQQELQAKSELLMRTAAEFDNFKKRTERERTSIAEFAKSGILKQLLPILDNVDRALAADKGSDDYIKGVELIIKQFEGCLDSLGLKVVGNVGEEFDPNFHEAVMHVEDETLGENVIAEVLQKGYMFGDTVLRAAMVKVAN